MPSPLSPVPQANAGRVLDDHQLRAFLSGRQRHRERLAEPELAGFLGETLTLTAGLVPSEAGSLLLDDPRDQGPAELTFVAAFGEKADAILGAKIDARTGIAGHVYKTGEVYVSNDVQNDPLFLGDTLLAGLTQETETAFHSRSIVAAPLCFQDRVCGVFELVNRAPGGGFSEHDVEIVNLVSGYISRALLNAIDVTRKNELALIDDLTGLRNSRGMDRAMQTAIEQARREEGDVGVLFIDLDRLKAINDSRGHRYGSAAIARTGHVIRDVVGERGKAFRFGGDEFVVLVPLVPESASHALESLAERIVHHVRRCGGVALKGGGSLPELTVSVGAASMRRNLGADVDEDTPAQVATRLLTAADRALYRAKRKGRNRVVLATRRDDTLQRPITGVSPRDD